MRVRDVDRCQIRLDEEVKAVESEWFQALVKFGLLGRRDGAYLVKSGYVIWS